jgi:hypothetical protein
MEFSMPVDPTAHRLAEEVAAARQALIERTSAAPGEWWQAWDLKAKVRNGWGAGVTGLALGGLIADGTFEVQGDSVRLSG